MGEGSELRLPGGLAELAARAVDVHVLVRRVDVERLISREELVEGGGHRCARASVNDALQRVFRLRNQLSARARMDVRRHVRMSGGVDVDFDERVPLVDGGHGHRAADARVIQLAQLERDGRRGGCRRAAAKDDEHEAGSAGVEAASHWPMFVASWQDRHRTIV